jgi:hypothetical protein
MKRALLQPFGVQRHAQTSGDSKNVQIIGIRITGILPGPGEPSHSYQTSYQQTRTPEVDPNHRRPKTSRTPRTVLAGDINLDLLRNGPWLRGDTILFFSNHH